MHIVIYQWCTRTDFLLQILFPDAQIIEARPLVDDKRLMSLAEQIAAEHPEEQLHWFFQINLSYSEHWLGHRSETLTTLQALGFHIHNSKITDIRKRSLQTMIHQLGLNSVKINKRDAPGSMAVMVKSNYNYGGEFESLLSSAEADALGFESVNDCEIQSFDSYYVTTVAEVDEALWQDQRIVIERYIQNNDQRFYRFYRCGDKVVLSQVINPDEIKKMAPGLPRKNWFFDFNASRNHQFQSLIDDVTLLLQRMDMYYGAIDIVMDDRDQAFIIDANPTPGWGREKQQDILAFLREGI